MKKKWIYLVLFILIISCNTIKEEPIQKKTLVELSNFSFNIPENFLFVNDTSKMKTGKLTHLNSPDINLYNFGNMPISINANLERWKLQFDTIKDLKLNISTNELTYFYEINGEINKADQNMFALIIPSNNGPYYIKSICDSTELKLFRNTFNTIFESIVYK